jgi:threonine/homoserine/homoserine lactone efflux protein
MLGVSIGFPIMLVAVAAGGGRLLTHHPAALTVMRWLGASYLMYLAWRVATAPPSRNGHETPLRSGRPLSFFQAASFQWINPKAWLITLSALATLTSVAHHPSFARALLLAAVFLTVTFPITAFWTSVGVGVSRVLRTEEALRWFNVVMGTLLVASVVSVLTGIG